MPKLKLGKLSRREGIPMSPSVSIAKVMQKRSYGPGVHGPKQTRRRVSTYGQQLREKQKAKILYNIRERQFRNYYENAVRRDGETGSLLIRQLEMRLDNVIFRLGFAKTRQQAAQMVSHKFFTINGRPVNVRSMQVRVGDEIKLKDTKKQKRLVEDVKEYARVATVPGWLSADADSMTGRVLSLPEGEDLQQPFNSKLIIEFYSR